MRIRSRIAAVISATAIAALATFSLSSSALAATTTVDAAGGNLQFNNTVKIGQNAPVGFSTRYSTVFTGVDAIVTVKANSNSTLNNIDRVSTVNNWQLWTNLQVGAGGGFTTYRVEFVTAGTRDPVVMKNFSANVGDIDAKQYVQFTGPSSYTVSQNSQLNVSQSDGAYKFSELNGTGSTDDDTRFWAQVTYSQVSSIDVTLGAAVGGSALYQVSFGAASWGSTAAAPVTPPVTNFTVTYDKNTGESLSGSTGPTTVASGSAATILANGFGLPTNYTFNSWNTQPDGSGVKYVAGDSIRPTTNVTLYAIWDYTIANVTVTYHTDGSESGAAPTQASIAGGSQYVILGNTGSLTKAGYEFIGWNTNSDGTSGAFYQAGEQLQIVANTNLYPVWRLIPVVPPDAPINIDVEPGDPIGGGEVDYVIPDQPYDPNCNPTTNPSTAWSITVTPVEPEGAPFEIDAGCTPPNGDIYGTAVLPQDVPEGIYEIVYESTTGEKVIEYFEVGPGGTFIGQTSTDPRLADTGSSNGIAAPLALIMLTAGAAALVVLRRRRVVA